MTKERITKGLKCCAVEFDCTKCPYYNLHDSYDTCIRQLMLDILQVLSPNAEPKGDIAKDNFLEELK